MTTKTPEQFTYKTTTVGDGRLYGWNKFNEKGDIVESSVQHWSSEADAEAVIRTIAPKTDIIEVAGIKNVNADANANVRLVTPKVEEAVMPNPNGDELHAGMEVVHESIEEVAEKGTDSKEKKN